MTPGSNSVRVQWLAVPGRYVLGQVKVELGHLQFVSQALTPAMKIEVKREEPTLRLDKSSTELLAGLPQTMLLTVTVGSYQIAAVSTF